MDAAAQAHARDAIVVAAAAFDIVEKIGMPEAQLTLGQAAIYMATAPKSNRSYVAINAERGEMNVRSTAKWSFITE